MSAALHRFGRAALLEAWPVETGEQPTIPELQIAGAVANLESSYGRAPFHNLVTGESKVLGNWGAIQDGKPPCNGITNWEATDTSPLKVTADNPRGEYQACFKRFADDDPAAPAVFIHQITTRRPDSWAAMKNGDIDAFSTAMHTRHGSVGAYYEGFGATAAEQIDHHASAVAKGVAEIAAAMNEPVLAVRGGSGPGGSGLGGFGTWLEAGAWVTAAFGLGFAVRRYRERHGYAR